MESSKKVYVGMAADIIHKGHINIINVASSYGDVYVGLLSDEAIKSYKRNPIITYEDRYIVLKSLRQVNNIIKQNTLDYTSNLLNIRPEFVVHGDDWINGPQKKTRDKVIEILKEWNGQVIDVPYTTEISTTSIINNIINSN
jgi:cytidyltransferase-like protein